MKTYHKNRETAMEKLTKYFAVAMAVAYVGLGIFLLTDAQDTLIISRVQATVLSILCTGYGLYRGLRVYQRYYKHKYDR